jgi:hypothetical protein
MSATEEFVITLPAKTANFLHQRVAEGGFESPTDYFENLMVNDMLSPPPNEEELVHWMNTEGARRLDALHADPSIGLTIDEAFAGLLDEEEEAG